MTDEVYFGGSVRRIQTRNFVSTTGVLSPVDFASLGFNPVRAFVVAAPAGSRRGGHGHRRGRQILMLVSGLIDVEIRWQSRTRTLRLDPAHRALLIEPPVWARQTYLGEHPAMVVFCDTDYDPTDYVHDEPRINHTLGCE
jgi:dTDP-4-dehydrorhamnose 3,5-epimerase-like enzyme